MTRGSCVENKNVTPFSRLSRCMRSMICSLVFESRFAVGSSARTSSGCVMSARAMATRCRWPPESSSGRCWRKGPSPTSSASCRTRLRSVRSGSRFRRIRQGNSTFSTTFSTGMRLNDWKMKPINLIPVLNVVENVEFPCLMRRKREPLRTLRKRVRQLAEEVGLGPFLQHRPDELSGGQRQRVAIARALITHPELVLADEPTANLDSKTSEHIIDLMQRLNREKGVTFVFSTHDPRVMQHAQRVVHIADGRIAAGA